MRRVAVVLLLVASSARLARAISIEKLAGGGRLAAYVPRGWDPAAAKAPSARGLRTDAERLAAVGFTAVTTYGASRELVPVCRIFKRHGFRTVLVGIADPRARAEVARAVRLKRCADGYVVGTGGIAAGRYGRDDLVRTIERVRAKTGRPVTTREPLATYASDPTLVRAGDWLFPIVQPWSADKREGQDACGWAIFAYRDLAERAPAGVPTLVAETGLPTEGALATSEHYQRAFFLCLVSRQVPFAYFEAFDQPWRADGVGPHWGLFRADGSPKLWAAQQMQPSLEVERRGATIRGRVEHGVPDMLRVVAYAKGERWELQPDVRLGRRGAWRLDLAPGRPAVVYVASRTWTPPPVVERLPVVDRMRVFAQRELPPL